MLPQSRFARYAAARGRRPSARSRSALFSYGLFANGLDDQGAALLARRRRAPAVHRRRDGRGPRSSARWPSCSAHPAPGFGGSAGRLARQNAVRNPSRTASTAAAVMIGLALITFVAVHRPGRPQLVHRARSTSCSWPTTRSTRGKTPLTSEAAHGGSRRRPASTTSPRSARRGGQARTARRSTSTASTRTCRRCSTSQWNERLGRACPAQLGRHGAFVTTLRGGSRAARRVAAPRRHADRQGADAARHGIFDEPKGGSPFGDVTVSTATFDRAFADHATSSRC